LSLVHTLSRLGLEPVRESEREAWYLSPFRRETKPSFKVSKTLNRWYDHGSGIGGNNIDLVTKIKSCSVKEALAWLGDGSIESFVQPPPTIKDGESGIQIIKTMTLEHPALIQYLKNRRIPLDLARRFVSEVHFAINHRRYFALGLKNGRRGWELRSKYHKLCASPKGVSYLQYGHKKLCVVEGMFDLLSLVKLDPKWSHKADILVLNSLALIGKSKEILSRYKRLELALDNDPAGDRATQQLMGEFPRARDRRKLYGGHKDLNDKVSAEMPPI